MFKIGLDLGYGYVKGINEAGKAVVFPSLVGNAYDRSLKGLFENNPDRKIDNMHLVIMNGEKYECFVGELARRESRNVSYAVFLAGGGAKDLQEFFTDIYENTVIVKDPQLANARGFLKVAELEEKKVAR